MATRKSYAEQLKHPNWQRKRLEVLEAAGWQCETCCAKDKTLHVHHKRYVKGREVWEYEASELEALCEDCHEETHEAKAFIEEILAQYPSVTWPRVAALLVGYGSDYVEHAMWLRIESDAWARAGEIAEYALDFNTSDALELRDLLVDIDPQTLLQVLRAHVRQEHERGGEADA